MAGLTVAQISEFSLILAALGLSLGDIDRSTVALITTVGIITHLAHSLSGPSPLPFLQASDEHWLLRITSRPTTAASELVAQFPVEEDFRHGSRA
ncbi:MAG: hypothetical protein R6X23_16140 [Acidimicrobiia bacterium]